MRASGWWPGYGLGEVLPNRLAPTNIGIRGRGETAR